MNGFDCYLKVNESSVLKKCDDSGCRIEVGIEEPTALVNGLPDLGHGNRPTAQRADGESGIGLTIARALVESQGGRIWAESGGEGQGSTLLFKLPIAK